MHSGISVGITNQLAAVVFNYNSGGDSVVVVAVVSSVKAIVGGHVDGTVSVRLMT